MIIVITVMIIITIKIILTKMISFSFELVGGSLACDASCAILCQAIKIVIAKATARKPNPTGMKGELYLKIEHSILGK